jgi:hypothetical protein
MPRDLQPFKSIPSFGQALYTSGYPAFITVQEILADNLLWEYNLQVVTPTITAAKNAVGLTSVAIPVIFRGVGTNNAAVAFTPNLVNLQVVNSQPYFPMQFGPKHSGKDVLEDKAAQNLGLQSIETRDCWTLYHCRGGEVHCGTAVKRTAQPNWWTTLNP